MDTNTHTIAELQERLAVVQRNVEHEKEKCQRLDKQLLSEQERLQELREKFSKMTVLEKDIQAHDGLRKALERQSALMEQVKLRQEQINDLSTMLAVESEDKLRRKLRRAIRMRDKLKRRTKTVLNGDSRELSRSRESSDEGDSMYASNNEETDMEIPNVLTPEELHELCEQKLSHYARLEQLAHAQSRMLKERVALLRADECSCSNECTCDGLPCECPCLKHKENSVAYLENKLMREQETTEREVSELQKKLRHTQRMVRIKRRHIADKDVDLDRMQHEAEMAAAQQRILTQQLAQQREQDLRELELAVRTSEPQTNLNAANN